MISETARRLMDFFMGVTCRCALCGDVLSGDVLDTGICRACLNHMAAEMRWTCGTCGVPVRPGQAYCPVCITRGYWFDAVKAAGVYRGNLKDAIIRMKYRGERDLRRPLGKLLVNVAQCLPPCDVIVPVPIDPARKGLRGFDQACDLAEELSQALGLDVDNALKRRRSNISMTALSRRDRWEEVKNTIELARSSRAGRFVGSRVLLVDDVVTTGATVNACSRVLKEAGAAEVYVVAVARTVL
ncbi:MAG: ComF family protein [Firmicutes bacterium]|nr:ComF family protein [Candidatus Fermentithermobacillaceae bacterium]